MQNTLIQGPAQKKLDILIDEQNRIIYDEKNWIGKDLWKIAEVTYSYDSDKKNNININTTLFVKGGGLNLELYKKTKDKKLLLIAKDKLEKLILEKKEQIQAALNEIEIMDRFSINNNNTNLKIIFINSLKEKNNFLDYCLNTLPFELEKAGIKLEFSKGKEKEIEKKQSKLNTKLFGEKIKDNPEESKLAYEYIKEKYNEGQNNLNKDEQKRFEFYINQIKSCITKTNPKYKYYKKEKPKYITGNFLNNDISLDDTIAILNLYTDALKHLPHIVETSNTVASISDGPNYLHIPTTEKFKFLKIDRILKLGVHEIITHNRTDEYGKKYIGDLRGANSLEKDEGVAMLMEQLFLYGEELYKIDEDGDKIIDIDKIQINGYFTKTIMGELLNNDELLDFLKLSEKISPDYISPEEIYLRLKRNNKEGVQGKDALYLKGLFKAIKEINLYIKSKGIKGIKPEDLFIGKVSFEETPLLKEIKKNKKEKGEITQEFEHLFISDAIHFIITKKLEGKEGNITSKEYYNYLKKKYHFFDFTEEQIIQTSKQTKRDVYGIVNILLKNIGENDINKIYYKNKVFNTQLKDKLKNTLFGIIGNQYNHKILTTLEQMHPNRQNAVFKKNNKF